MTGRTILRAQRIDAPPGPKYARLEEAAGQTIRAVERRGKFLLLPLARGPVDGRVDPRVDDAPASAGGPDDVLVIHLGMTGVLSATPPMAHERVRLSLDDGPDPVLHFRDVRRFGRFLLLPGGDTAGLPTLAAMGPEPLSAAFTKAAFGRALRRSDVAIKTSLLSQRPVAGVGNIYADEALWRARVHPATPARRVPRAKVGPLRDAIRAVLEASIEAQGTTLNDYRTVNGEVGAYLEHLAVYGHAGEPCPRCGHGIERIVLGGRGTHLCPECQPAPGRRRRRR
ncbi:MAG: bifunctional DNA-formamidopyrimidine glycosylase/DNA-(apurinic or apyrimidinic site) lyase, partial [Trueperaceae bacterium]|nr:bifunctional DNA-formamidopyrimidine glycosylase/DNA-(apurinic or apyrimidinic site) lyase [Trueperaceae bacterium]